MLVDLPESQLRSYLGSTAEPDDFDGFWSRTLDEARATDLDLRIGRVDSPLKTITVFDVTFNGFGGQPINAWLKLPSEPQQVRSTIVEYIGYGGGRGFATENLLLASTGFAHFVMDTRGQGSTWSVGSTADPGGSGPHVPGFLTRGIEAPETYYYRRLITDAVRAVDAARALDLYPAGDVSVQGVSQGGGLALAVAGLVPDLAGVVARVPFLSDFPRAISMTDAAPYKEISSFLATRRHDVDTVLRTLSYVDGVNFAKRATAPAYFSAALMDAVCPPSTVFAAYNNYAGADKFIEVWPFNGHEGGGHFDDLASVRFHRRRESAALV